MADSCSQKEYLIDLICLVNLLFHQLQKSRHYVHGITFIPLQGLPSRALNEASSHSLMFLAPSQAPDEFVLL